MAHENLGLFDTPPDRQEIRLGLMIVGLLLAAFLIILPVHDIELRQVDAFIPMIDAVMFVSELVTAALLYAQAAVFRSRALTVLATGFVIAALLLIPHALTFPGAFAPDGLLDAGVNTTAWIYTFRRCAIPIAVIFYVLLRHDDSTAKPGTVSPSPRIALSVFAAVAVATAIILVATSKHELLPPFYFNRTDRLLDYAGWYHFAVFALYAVATLLLFRKRKSVLDMWLLVAISGRLIQALLNVPIHARFTLGWYALFAMMLASSLIVMIALIAESSWLYARLAHSTSARQREREARLMSMNAVTAAISHEVGQPLTAVRLNSAAALNWLQQQKPDVKKAIAALKAIDESGKRTFDVIRSLRAMFAKGHGPATVFDFNDLVRETSSLLQADLAVAKATLEFSLVGDLPPIRADRVQIQRVLINLLTNAIESLGPIRGGPRRLQRGQPRRIVIHSQMLDHQNLLLEISDTGPGIAQEDLERIFDPFYTTKSHGTGLGLSLCRSIVEDHGGQLWASQREKGATFHLKLRTS